MGDFVDVDFLRQERDLVVQHQSFSNGFVFPDYERLNTKNLSSVVGEIFAVDSLGKSALPDGYVNDHSGISKVLLFIVDGLGYNHLLNHLSSHSGTFSDLVQKGVFKPLTTTFPSTTSTALASIFTGLSPAQHGIIGYQMFSKEHGLVFDTLDMKPVFGYSSHVDMSYGFRKVRPWLASLEQNEIVPVVVTRGSLVGSGLSRIIHRDQAISSYQLQSDMFVQCKKTLELPDRTFQVIYYPGIDTLEHRYGPYSEEVTSEMQSLECGFRNFFDKLSSETKKETMLLLTADHGVAETAKFHYVKDYPEVNTRLLLPPVGDSRAAFLFSKPGQNEALSTAFKNSMPDIKLLSSTELVDRGAFGRAANMESLRESVGDFTALSTDHAALSYPFFEDDRHHEQLGTHGGMTAEEILVPFLSVRLSKV